MTLPDNIHVSRTGPDPSKARLTMILVHGRGASSADILGLADETQEPFLATYMTGYTYWHVYAERYRWGDVFPEITPLILWEV